MSYTPVELRHLVIERAGNRCEYCLFPQTLSLLGYEMEHIIALKHGGTTDEANLALACPHCNRAKGAKGTDLGSLDAITGQLTAFYNPRTQNWQDHFRLQEAFITLLTAEGRVTVAILQLNLPERVLERQRFITLGLYS